ncbi:tryparedoxin-like protein [Leptomonas pyrrhocoris]|uniref:Tryparedoxin-like protein n=1 Tax=Leptomonas pyrrhocoris TaxID=157538 RepID=A0A0N0DUD8_LEPPY|nr:tryparedoxin-like protein [Leptomonas pyrrhocoris]KPA78784.1 tryparedoxin-like protein [Leptomonas pyrrhocoris]|eukprot:XP_015657223.1 tryparedoxin-like protein [Leptomonas pyrrhocoris]
MPSNFFAPTQQLLCKDGSSVLASHALSDAAYVLVYFAAGWCEPCCEFAPLLKSFYEKHHSEKAFEVVLLSFDNSEQAMMDYFVNAHGSYYCLPYADAHAMRTEWMEQYNVRGLPSLVIFENADPRAVVTRYGCNMVVSDPEGASFPWPNSDPMPGTTPPLLLPECTPEVAVAVTFPTVLDAKDAPSFFDNPAQMLLRQDGSSVSATEALRAADYVLVCCSAQWCPHCRDFTPLMKRFYEAHHVEKKFEVVFLSFDTSEKEMMDYFKKEHGNYYCLPYNDAQQIGAVWTSLYDFDGIPTVLVFEKTYPRVFITNRGRDLVVNDPDAEYFPWEEDKAEVVSGPTTTVLSCKTVLAPMRSRLQLGLLILFVFVAVNIFCAGVQVRKTVGR